MILTRVRFMTNHVSHISTINSDSLEIRKRKFKRFGINVSVCESSSCSFIIMTVLPLQDADVDKSLWSKKKKRLCYRLLLTT